MMANRNTYEIMTPESVGIAQTTMVLGEAFRKARLLPSGSMSWATKLRARRWKRRLRALRNWRTGKKTVTDRDIEALVSTQKSIVMPVYELESFVISSGSAIQTMATVCLTKDGELKEAVVKADGPIDAAFSAVEKIVGSDVELKTYSIQAITEGGGRAGRGCGAVV